MPTITTYTKFPTSTQIPSEAILDLNGKQHYLGNAFSAPVSGLSLSTTNETNLMLISNAVTNTKSLFVYHREISSSAYGVTVKLYSNPTVSNAGTSITPVNYRPASSRAATGTTSYSPTTSANGTLIDMMSCGSGYEKSESGLLIILDPGQSLLMTGKAATATTVIDVAMGFYEL